MLDKTNQDVLDDIFDGTGDWYFPEQASLYPNFLAFHEACARLVVVVVQSKRGGDHPVDS
jgi:hypothetical protein